MPYFLLIFAAGVLVGKKWASVRGFISPLTSRASERFEELYSETARKVGTKVEDIEDRMAEARFKSRLNGS